MEGSRLKVTEDRARSMSLMIFLKVIIVKDKACKYLSKTHRMKNRCLEERNILEGLREKENL